VALKIIMINCAEYNDWKITKNHDEGIPFLNIYDENYIPPDFKSYSFSNVPIFEYGSSNSIH
jgi:hypothetical protein